MKVTTLSFDNMGSYGELFPNLMRARRDNFIVRNKWDLPEADGMEFDQYDTPASRWIAVHEYGEILAGVRLTPTTAKCGIYSYMIADAQKGMLESIPSDLLYVEAPVNERIWESSRVFVSSSVPAKSRMRVQASLMTELISAAKSLGAEQLFGIVPAVWERWIGRLSLEAGAAGPKLNIGGEISQVASMRFTAYP